MNAFPQSIRELGCLPFAEYIDAITLAPNSAETFQVPAGAKFVTFSATGDFFARANGAASIPTDVADGSSSELNPTMRSVVGVSSISVIASAVATVTAAFYS